MNVMKGFFNEKLKQIQPNITHATIAFDCLDSEIMLNIPINQIVDENMKLTKNKGQLFGLCVDDVW